MMVLSIDVTPWAVVVIALGALFGALIKRPLYGVFVVFATFFGIYSLTPIFGMPYDVFVTVSWLLSAFFGTSSMSNLVATWIRRIETQLQMLAREMETLRLMVEEER
jgi:phosphoribosylcarboxyaminoimidazole (NCAIR) mutase